MIWMKSVPSDIKNLVLAKTSLLFNLYIFELFLKKKNIYIYIYIGRERERNKEVISK